VNVRKASTGAATEEAILAREAAALAPLPAGYTDGLTMGKLVHYTLDNGPHRGQHRAAFVTVIKDQQAGLCNLMALVDEINDGFTAPFIWRTGIRPDPAGQTAGTWHYAEKAEQTTFTARGGGTATPDDPGKPGGQT
jgi:hypothetical protein